MENKKRKHKTPKAKTEHEPCSQEEINRWKVEKSIQIKTVGICKTITKKSSPDLFNFWVISAGYDMANDAGRATKCKRNFKAP